jgi:hypothetical protein
VLLKIPVDNFEQYGNTRKFTSDSKSANSRTATLSGPAGRPSALPAGASSIHLNAARPDRSNRPHYRYSRSNRYFRYFEPGKSCTFGATGNRLPRFPTPA